MSKITKVSVLILVVLAVLFAGVASAYAANPTSTQSVCVTPFGGPKACLKAKFEWNGGNVRIVSKWTTVSNISGWTVLRTELYCNSSCGAWTSGSKVAGATWKWYHNGVYQGKKSCALGGDAINWKLYVVRSCG